MDLKDVELEKVYDFKPEGGLDACAVRDIRRYLRDNLGNAVEFSDGFDWSVEGLPKRIVKDLGVENDVGSSFMGGLGGLIGSLALPVVDFHFRFTNNFGWINGEYGDLNSCLFVEGHRAPKILQYNQNWAIQFLNADGKGIGRCLIARHEEDTVLFNAYGLMYVGDKLAQSVSDTKSRQDTKVSFVAALLARFTGLDYKRVDFQINDSTGDPIYINGGFGYLLGPWREIRLARSMNLRMKTDIIPICERCKKYLNSAEELLEVPVAYTGHKKLCAKCKALYEFKCAACGTPTFKKAPGAVTGNDGRQFCSTKCASASMYRQCHECGGWFAPGAMLWLNDPKVWVCQTHASLYASCIFCYKTVPNGATKLVVYSPKGSDALTLFACPACAKNIQDYGDPHGDPKEVEVRKKARKAAKDEN